MIRIGIDVGSTTAKVVAAAQDDTIIYKGYERHNARAREVVTGLLKDLLQRSGDDRVSICITGSVGMGMAEKCSLPFVQEVVAATKAVRDRCPQASAMIDIGGEDAKVVFFRNGEAADLRMNGNCAGGTGAFIDQMAIILGVTADELDALAAGADRVYPVASRCGVFCKTDIQNLVAKNVSRENIAASIFHAVAVQTAVTLAHGCDIKPPVVFCGGPLSFIASLRKAFMDYLSLSPEDVILPQDAKLVPAFGAALSAADGVCVLSLSDLIGRIETGMSAAVKSVSGLQPIFADSREYADWTERMSRGRIPSARFRKGVNEVFVGVDSGSTTTKIAVTDRDLNLLWSYYSHNGGNAVKAVETGFAELKRECEACGAGLAVIGSCSTGYGEDLVKAAFQLGNGIIETMAHYMAARRLDPEVSFILDIGGQDMKAIFVHNGVIDRIEINEACSSGCGSFIETFAMSLGYSAEDFAAAATRSSSPSDLGTRCTVFMNSKVKQVLREGASIEDISAGLAYSVVKNCLYKVLKLKDVSVLGKHVVVQGGTMRNDAVVRAIEILTGAEVSRCDRPEIMGAYGCAIYAMNHPSEHPVPLDDMLGKAGYTSDLLHCRGCENSCAVTRYTFSGGRRYYSGNRCEKVFSNGGGDRGKGENAYLAKNALLFGREADIQSPRLTLGIPRCLNMFEEYPFWHTLFTSCGIQVMLSDVSDYGHYESCARMVMSDNICFPAKLVHSHIDNLVRRRPDRIFMPFVVFEKKGEEQNSYNCPIVAGYSAVVRNVQEMGIPFDSPIVSFKERRLLRRQCRAILKGYGVDVRTAMDAFVRAEKAQSDYEKAVAAESVRILEKSRSEGRLTVLLAGRPYHADPLIQHKVSEMIAGMGVNVITDDIARGMDIPLDDVNLLPQWAYVNRIMRAAKWSAMQGDDVQYVELTSFGCGPDAFMLDEIRDLLMRHGKVLTLLKLDDISNVGSMKLRVRSMIDSLRLSRAEGNAADGRRTPKPFVTVPVYEKKHRSRKILVPFFTPFISPLIPPVMKQLGYDVENLPMSDKESAEWGLKYANNEVCYPATLVVGDIIKAFKSGKHDPAETAVAMTQTGGQCRASNYVALIKSALVDAGYGEVPVIAVNFASGIDNYQPGFTPDWKKVIPCAMYALLYSDSIAKFYYASAVREKTPGAAAALRDRYLNLAADAISQKKGIGTLVSLLESAADDFNAICLDIETEKVGIVGEIYLKFNPFAQKNVSGWFVSRKIEVAPPILTDFFMQFFVNRKVKDRTAVTESFIPEFVFDMVYRLAMEHVEKFNRIGSRFRYFIPFNDVFEEAEGVRDVITLNAQFGEGWLLPAEIVSYYRSGVKNVVSLQPFGCIANHIVVRGVEKKLKSLYPDLNLLALDFDSGVSDVNVANRLLLFLDNVLRRPSEAAAFHAASSQREEKQSDSKKITA